MVIPSSGDFLRGTRRGFVTPLSPVSRKPLRQIIAWTAVIFLSSLAALAQTSTPATAATTPPAEQSGQPSQLNQSTLPDEPLPVASPPHSQDQTMRQQFSTAQPSNSFSSDPKAHVTVLEDTLIRVRTNEPVSSRHSKDGQLVSFTLSEDVFVGNQLVIPRGATLHGEVIQSKKAGVLTGTPQLTLKLVSLDLGGQSYPLYTYEFKAQGTSKTKPTETRVKGGAVIGAIVGGAFSGSAKGGSNGVSTAAGMGTGAALGAGVGAVASAATPGPVLTIPAEAQLDFHLASPISVTPVSAKEAARLSQGLRPGGPVLYVRGDAP